MMKTIFGAWWQGANGLLVLQLSKYALIGGTAKNAPRFYRIRLDGSGAIPAGQQIVANDQIMPEGTQYQATLYDTNSNVVFGPQMITICGPDPINLNQVISTPPPPVISVSISPTSVTLQSRGTQQFTTTVTNTTNRSVTFSTTFGTISASGFYTAPTVATTTAVTIAATSVADPTKSASAFISITPIAVTAIAISPSSVTLAPGERQQFTATLTPSNADQSVTWTATNGTITSAGVFTANNVTTATTATVTATSVEDTTKTATVSVSIAAPASIVVLVNPPGITLNQGQTQQFTASVAGITNQNVTWSFLGTHVGTLSAGGLYTAPATVTVQSSDTVVATSVGYPASTNQANITISLSGLTVAITPGSASLGPGETQQFTASVTPSTVNQHVTWSASLGTITAAGLFTAPNVTTTTLVTIRATSVANTSASTSVQISISAAVNITVLVNPPGITLNVSQTQQYTATVVGITDQNVTWSLQSGTPGVAAVGTLSAAGLYTAPATVSVQSADMVIATSVGFPAAQGQANITINAGGGPQPLDLVQWMISSTRNTQHLVGDPHAPYSVQVLDTDAIYPANYPRNMVWQVKNKLGNPWDGRRYDANYIYHWLTEDGDSVDNPLCQTANGTTCWLYARAYKRFVSPLRGWPRFLTPNAPPVTIDSVGPNTTNRTVDCEATLTGTIHLGDVRTITSGPIKYTWGGSIDKGAGTGANGPTLDSVNGVDTIKNEYYYSGTIANNDFKDREEYYYVKGFGEVAWYYYKRTSATAPWVWQNQTVNSTLASGGAPTPNFPCGPGKSWFV